MSKPDQKPSHQQDQKAANETGVVATAEARVITVGEHRIYPGERRSVNLQLPPLYTHASVGMPVHVIHGKRAGPTVFITAAIHGDEINGVEIIRRLLKLKSLDRIKGAIIAVPVVNVYGFIAQSRYLPDRRDLNRSFPGTERGSMASRLAELLMSSIIDQCTHGIDLHTGAAGRDNLPQIRVAPDAADETHRMAEAFAPPVILHTSAADGTLRHAIHNKPMILYEAGEALRFSDASIKLGVNGIVRVLRSLSMLTPTRTQERAQEMAKSEQRKVVKRRAPVVVTDSTWIRAPQSGIMRARVKLGDVVKPQQTLGIVADPFGEHEELLVAKEAAIVVGMSNLPLVHEGEALFHLARAHAPGVAAQTVDAFVQEYDSN